MTDILEVLSRGPATSSQLQAATGKSQGWVSTHLRRLGDVIITLRRGKTPYYVLSVPAFGTDGRIGLQAIDADGNFTIVAELRSLAHGGFFIEPRVGFPKVLAGFREDGLFDDLPYFLQDLRPKGFIGRQIAAALAERSDDFPRDPRAWRMHHVMRYLIANGDDQPGHLVVGDVVRLRLDRHDTPVSERDYPRLAHNALAGVVPGSSAGGEQAKFTAWNDERRTHVIVKFSPEGIDPRDLRWRDILLSEHHAAEALRAHDCPAAVTRVIDAGGRLFLESERFDRSGKDGRAPMVSLEAVDAEFVGDGHSWTRSMHALCERALVSPQHVHDTKLLDRFGRWIGNTDMHLGNLSLGIDGDVFRLLPVYDMCSMAFRPTEEGVPDYRREVLTIAQPETTDAEFFYSLSRHVAVDFWNRLAADERISPDLRQFLAKGNPAE